MKKGGMGVREEKTEKGKMGKEGNMGNKERREFVKIGQSSSCYPTLSVQIWHSVTKKSTVTVVTL